MRKYIPLAGSLKCGDFIFNFGPRWDNWPVNDDDLTIINSAEKKASFTLDLNRGQSQPFVTFF